jgi:hypothetical protein
VIQLNGLNCITERFCPPWRAPFTVQANSDGTLERKKKKEEEEKKKTDDNLN